MGVVRRFAVAGLDEAARKTGRRRGLAVGAVDETGQVKAGACTAGVKRQYLGCVGKVANGINTVHLTYAREGAGHALIGAREWIPAAQPWRPGGIGGHGPAGGPCLSHQGPAGHRHPRRGLRRRRTAGLRLRRRGLWRLHRAARVPGGPRPGLRAAGRFAPCGLRPRGGGAATGHPGYRRRLRLARARPGAGRPSALPDCGGDDRAGWDQVPALVVPFPGQGGRNYAVASSSAPVRRARISPMVRFRPSVSGSGRWAWIW
jgi:hypothetical protein